MDANWRLAAPAPASCSSSSAAFVALGGRGREAFPRQDPYGQPYRDCASVAVAQTEPANPAFRYHGPYVGNVKHGLGRYIVGDAGSSYLVPFERGEMRGDGTRYLADGTAMQGRFVDGELSGPDCVVLAPSGERYEGGFVGGARHGAGVLRWRTPEDGGMHQFAGDFANGAPCGAGVQVSTATTATATATTAVTDTIAGTFGPRGPHGVCTRTVDRRTETTTTTQKTRETFDGEYADGREHCDRCSFDSGTTGVAYTGPMRNRRRANIQNALVLEGARVVPLDTAKDHGSGHGGGHGGNPAAVVGAAAAAPTAPPSPSAPSPSAPSPAGGGGSGRRQQPATQDDVSWARPLVVATGQEVIHLRLCAAHLIGLVDPSSSSSSSSMGDARQQRGVLAAAARPPSSVCGAGTASCCACTGRGIRAGKVVCQPYAAIRLDLTQLAETIFA